MVDRRSVAIQHGAVEQGGIAADHDMHVEEE
ncbi:hypothetical protein ABIE78_002537 [Sinorhizobium fredii]|jgi:hypothetical protein